MKLTYRGHAYEISTSGQINSAADSPKPAEVKLIYRGQTYYATPRPTVVSTTSAVGSVVTFIYRGTTYQRVIPGLQSCRPTGAINWRYRVS
ncbi:MAG: DUF4278 domain-containing protein [Elainella sp.]